MRKNDSRAVDDIRREGECVKMVGEDWLEPRRVLAEAVLAWEDWNDPTPPDLGRAMNAWQAVIADEDKATNMWVFWHRAHSDAAELAEAAETYDSDLIAYLRAHGAVASFWQGRKGG